MFGLRVMMSSPGYHGRVVVAEHAELVGAMAAGVHVVHVGVDPVGLQRIV